MIGTNEYKKKAICLECGIEFTYVDKYHTRKYCCPEHRAYKKIKEKLEGCPVYKCPDCGISIKLDFSPVKDPKRWKEFNCKCKKEVKYE